MKARSATYTLSLPASIKAEAEKHAKEDGVSLNQFVATAVAEKVSARRTVNYFTRFRAHADLAAFDRIMNRNGRETAGSADELPDIAEM